MPKFPICADSRDEYKFQKKQPRSTALAMNRWITFNESFLNLLIFDLDYLITIEEAKKLCIDRVGLEPTYICATENGVHIGYALENCVMYEWTKTIELAQRIKVAVSDALDADTKGSHRLRGFWRNPLLHIHEVSYKAYSLEDFYPVLNEFTKNNLPDRAQFVDYLKQHHRNSDVDIEYRPGNRNASLWYRSMMATNHKMAAPQIESIVLGIHYTLSKELEYFPLDRLEVLRVARSVAKYNIEKRNMISAGTRKRVYHDNAGAMGFSPMRGLDEDEYQAERVHRQSLSALRTARMKSKETLHRIKDAILRVNFLGLDLTHKNIARFSERSRATISRYISEGLVVIDNVVNSVMSISSYIVIALVTSPGSEFFLLKNSFISFKKLNLDGFSEWRCVSPP